MHSANNPNPRDQKARTEIWLINLTMAATELSLESYHIEQVGDSISAKQLRRNAVMIEAFPEVRSTIYAVCTRHSSVNVKL